MRNSRAAWIVWCCLSVASIALVAAWAPQPAAQLAPSADVVERDPRTGQLLELMGQRLQRMHDVARWKWNHDQPISDPQREQALLEELTRQATELGLAAEFTRAFFQAQFEAGKQMQEADFARWQAEQTARFQAVPDLATELRPAIGRLSTELLEVLALLQTDLAHRETQAALREQAPAILRGEGIDDEVRRMALAPLLDTK